MDQSYIPQVCLDLLVSYIVKGEAMDYIQNLFLRWYKTKLQRETSWKPAQHDMKEGKWNEDIAFCTFIQLVLLIDIHLLIKVCI